MTAIDLDATDGTSFLDRYKDGAPGFKGTALTCHWVFMIASKKEEAAKDQASRKHNDKATEGKEGRSSRRERGGKRNRGER